MSELTDTLSPSRTVASGRRLLAGLGIGAAASVLAGAATYYGCRLFAPVGSSSLTQAIAAEVYVLLIAGIAIAFRPLQDPPLAIRVASFRDLALSSGAWLATVAISFLAYVFLKPAFGGLQEVLRKILSVATDVVRLKGQPAAAWAIAIPRGCLLAPFFEEIVFRGALLGWLRKHLSDPSAILVSAILFSVMHVYPVVMPYAFTFGLLAGWIRIRTGSTLNMYFMHVLNNVLFLYWGFAIFR